MLYRLLSDPLPQDVKLKNRISLFAVNYSVIHNTAAHDFYLNLWTTEDFVGHKRLLLR